MNQDWKRLNIWDHRKELSIGKTVDFPANLYLERRVNSQYIYTSWLPKIEDDPREIKKKKKRRAFSVTTGVDNPINAAPIAINWVKQKQNELQKNVITQVDHHQNSLEHYWHLYFPRFIKDKQNRASCEKLIRDEKNKWFSPTYGLNKEEFAHKNIRLISRSDLENYFVNLSVGLQKDLKTLIRKLFALAESDCVGHQFPSFPVIKSSKGEQVKHFQFIEWETLMSCINQLSGGVAREQLSLEQYLNLEVKQNRQNQRNWVDLFDALWVQYYWFLRSEDGQKLRVEWFEKDLKNREFILRHPTPKTGRKVEETRNIKDDAFDFMLRLLMRRPSEGWLLFPNYKRQCEGGQENQVMRNTNFLLKRAVEKCLPNFPIEKAIITTVRHTTFRHHLEDDPTLGDRTKIGMFAKNGLTSPEMLQRTYLDYISREATLRESKSKMRKSNYSLIKRVS